MLVSEAMALTAGPTDGMVMDMAGVAGVTPDMVGVTRATVGATQAMVGATRAMVGATRDMVGAIRDMDGVTLDMVGVTLDMVGDITRDIRVITALEHMANDMRTIQEEMRVIRGLTQETSALKTNLMRQEGLLLQETWPHHMIRTETELPTEAAVLKLKTVDPIVKDQITPDLMRVLIVIINLETTGQEITTAGHRITTADPQHLLTEAVHLDTGGVLQVQEVVPEDVKCPIIMLITN